MLSLADKVWQRACTEDPHLRAGPSVHDGQLTYGAVARALDLPCVSTDTVLAA
ncbi:hypothetical protein V8J36_22350 [Frigidibacter sp. MR17.14]|uniref:hypothetical protein n=1 Tax=Frigidibacter sp. MR17.14 TaxID=3126509 RepID=UPI003012BADB